MTEQAQATEQKTGGVRARLIVLILVTQTLLIWWVVDSEVARGIYLICYTLMMPTVLYLLLTRVFRRWLPFDDRELLLCYIVLTCTLPVIGFGGLRFLVAGMGYLPYIAKTQPTLAKYLPFLYNLPVLHNPEAIDALYRGRATVPWQAWTVPILYWSTYLLLLSGIWLCLAGILRRIWIHQERLAFPIAVMPLQLQDKRENIFGNPLFWLGFAIPAVMQSLLVFHNWWPGVPAFQLKASYFTFASPPWNAIPGVSVGFYPMAIGLAYFIPGDVSLSCWLLSVAMKFVYVAGAIAGLQPGGSRSSGFPFQEEQAAGAWLAFAGLIIWGARHHWRTVSKQVSADEQNAVRTLAVSALVCTLLCAAMMAAVGIRPIAALGMVVVYVAYVIAGARIRAEAGGLWTFAPVVWTPHRVTSSLLGTEGVGLGPLAAQGYFGLLLVDIRAQSLPYLMEGMDIAERSGMRWKTVLKLVAFGTVTALAVGWAASLTKYYALGAAMAKINPYPTIKVGREFAEVERLVNTGGARDIGGVAAMVAAGAFTLFLAYMRRAGIFGLHPVGYVLCNTLIMNAFIVPFFIAWLAKTFVLRLGGQKTYRQSVPLFVGIVLGDVVIQAFWAMIGGIFKVPIYQFLS